MMKKVALILTLIVLLAVTAAANARAIPYYNGNFSKDPSDLCDDYGFLPGYWIASGSVGLNSDCSFAVASGDGSMVHFGPSGWHVYGGMVANVDVVLPWGQEGWTVEVVLEDINSDTYGCLLDETGRCDIEAPPIDLVSATLNLTRVSGDNWIVLEHLFIETHLDRPDVPNGYDTFVAPIRGIIDANCWRGWCGAPGPRYPHQLMP